MPRRKSTDIVQMKLSIREDLRQYIGREAKKRGHSLDSEIVRRLEHSRQRDTGQAALQQIASTSSAVESAMSAVDELLAIVKRPDPGKLAQREDASHDDKP